MFKNSDFKCKSCYNKYNNTNNKWRNKGQGVYGIFSGQSCLYIGESKQLNNRISQHKTYIKNPNGNKNKYFIELYNLISQHKDITFKVLEETPNHKTQERIWIEYLCPLYNTL
jgi:excinuclease UvrABC nuclease subunit